MTWDYAIPVNATEVPAAESLMDEEAFAAFYQRTAPALWAYLARASDNSSMADDLLQESYLRFLRASRHDLDETGCRRYLFQIASNLLKDTWRRTRRLKWTPVDELPESALPVSNDRASERFESRSLLGPARARMLPRERQLLWLAYAEGATHGEISEITGVGRASVRILLFRARRKLARLLRQRARVVGRT